jgi:hypothetical protein
MALARACQEAAVRRAELRLVATTPAVRRMLAAQGLDRLVPVYSSVEAATTAGGWTISRRRSPPRSPIPFPRHGEPGNRKH